MCMNHHRQISPQTQSSIESRKKRAIYQSWHRGCRETDQILGKFCDEHVQDMNEAEMTLFEAFLEEDDADIWAWLVGKQICPRSEYEQFMQHMPRMPKG